MSLLHLAWAFFTLWALARVVAHRRETFDGVFTLEDRRRIAATVVYLLLPAAAWLQSAAQLACGRALGAEFRSIETYVLWNEIQWAGEGALSATGLSLVFASGLLAALGTSGAMILWTLRRPYNAALNFTRFEFARLQLWFVMGVYPLASLVLKTGDLWQLRLALRREGWAWGEVPVLLWALCAFVIWRLWKTRGRMRYLRLATPLFDRLQRARRELAERPQDSSAACEVARAHLALQDPLRAIATLGPWLAQAGEDAEVRFLTGIAFLRLGQAQVASEHLRHAGQNLEEVESLSERERELFFEVTLGLAATRLELRDSEGALMTAEAARSQRPGDPRGLLVLADALVALGRLEEARDKLAKALERAEGLLASEIRRRLRALDKSAATLPHRS